MRGLVLVQKETPHLPSAPSPRCGGEKGNERQSPHKHWKFLGSVSEGSGCAGGVLNEQSVLPHPPRSLADARDDGRYSLTLRSRSAFEITVTLLNVIAALAMIGLSRIPKKG